MDSLRRFLGREEGLSLIEMLVVVAILGILASLTAVAVTGTTSSSKGVTKEGDEGTVTKAVSRYNAEHPAGRYPTLDGCLPGKTLDKVTKTCAAGKAAQEFAISEVDTKIDVDLDGLTTSVVKVVPITWDQYFGTGDKKTFKGDYVKVPAHGFETRLGGSFKTSTADRTEGGPALTGVPNLKASCAKAGGISGDCPVWVLNAFGDAVALIPGSSY